MANFFDQFDKPAKGNFFDQFDGPEKKEGAFERAARIARDEDGGVLPAVGSLIASALPEGGDKRTAGGFFKDTAVDLTRGVVGLGQSAVGLGNLARGVIGTVAFGGLVSPGALGKDLEDLGYSGEQTQKFLSGLYTQDRQEADRNVEEAKGFFNTLGALAVNPSSLVGQVVQSVPQTVAAGAAGGAIVRALLPGATQAAAAAGLVGDDAANFISNYVSKRALAAAAGSEGALTAGSIAESGREAGQEFSTYAPAAVVGGVGTGLIGAASGAIGRRLGIGDIEADIAMRGAGVVPTAGAGSRLKQIGKDALKEGVLEEAPQSFQEQLATQYAQGRPFDLEEAASAAAQGLASGAVMGGAGALVRPRAPAQVPAAPADQDAALTGQAGRLTAATDAYLRGGLQSSDPTDVLSSVVSAPTPNGDIGAAITAADQAAGPSIEEMMRQKRQAAADRVAQELGYPTIDVNAPADGGLIADIQARSQAAVSAAQAELGLPPATAPVVQQDFAARRESAARAAQGELGIELPTAPPVVGDQLTPTQKQELVRQQMQAPARAPDLVTQVQQQVQTEPATTSQDVARVRTEVEEQALQRWQAEYDQQTAAQAEKQGVEAAKAATETQARMRESQDETALAELDRIAQGERQRAVDSLVRAYGERTQFSSAATVLQTNQQLTRLGQQPLTKSERDRVVTLLDSARTFTAPAQEQVQVIPDRGADNAVLEQQIPEKKDNLPRPANIGGQPAASYSVSQLTDLIANTSIPAITRRGAQVELLARQQEQEAQAPAAPALPAAVTPAGPTIVPSAKRTPEQGLQVAAAKRSEKTGQQVTFTVADVATLPTMAKAGGGLSKQAHTIINNVSRVFGKKLVVFDSDDAGAADGFVIDDDPDTIYLNRKSEVPHLVVFGHELLHSLRRDNKDAYESIVKSIKMAEGVDISETPGIRGDIEEFTADLLGNRFRETEFWVGTFRDIIASKGQAEGKKVVTRLAATATRAINGLMKALGRAPGFNTDEMVANLGDVKTALRGALSNYANQRYDAAVALERERLQGPARGETVPVAESGGEVVTSARRGEKPGQLDGLVGYHFSNQARQTLSTGFYGTGLRGSDRDEIQSYPDKRVGKRLSFYFDKGTGVRPESGVGGVAHRVALDNIYDSDSDPLKLKRGANKRAFEAAVLDAGFDGYMTRLEGTQPGQVVVLGDRTYQPEVLGPRSRIDDSEPAVAQAAQEPQWKNVATGPTREGLQDRMARMESSGSWSGYDMQIVEAGRGFYALQTRPKSQVAASEKRGQLTRGGVKEEVGGFTIRTQKDGTLGVLGDVQEIRALMPAGVVGRPLPGGILFPASQAQRVRAALEGRKVAYSRAGQVVERLPMKDGKYVGAPEKYNTPAKIATLRRNLRNLADEGAPGRYWYENSSREVLAMVGGNVQEARKFVALLAIYSPQAKVISNSTFALRAWAQYKAGQPISVKTGVMDRKAQSALDDVDAFWSGEKTGNFFNNLLREIDPSLPQGATIDMWMMRAAEYASDAPTATQYAFMENETNRLAQELGWEPQQVQAAIWVAMKARMENAGVKTRTEATSEKKGWIRFERNANGKKVRVIVNAQAHRDNWLKHAFQHDPTKSDTQGAKFDFSDGLRRHIGQLSWEARPGRTTGVLPGVNDAPYEQQVEFQQAVQKALLDDDGVDLLAYKLGLLVDGPDILAPGVWQGEIAAGMQKQVGMAPAKGEEGQTRIDPAQKKTLEVYASVLGLLLRQEGVGYHRPFYKNNKSEENAVNLDIGRTFTPAEAQALWSAMDQRMRAAGVPNWENDAGLVSSPDGMRVINYGALADNSKFRAMVASAAETLPVGEVSLQSFSTDGNLVTNNWKDNPNGEGYRSRISEAYGSYLLDWTRDVLAPRVQSVFDEFSSKYGWGNAGNVQDLFQRPAAPAPFTRARSLTQRQAGDTGPADVVASEPPAEPRVVLSEKRNIPDLNAAQEQALRNVGGVVVEQTVGERAAEFKNAFARNWIGGIFDQFNELRSLGPKAYMLARMSKGSEGTLEATMLYGKPFLTADGVADVKLGGEGFAKVLGKLEGEHDRFLWWVAAQRADQLKAQGLENLFTDKDISALKSLNQGNTARGTARGRLYAEALRDMNDFNDAILKIAEQSGLVDPEARALFKNNPYVPFYRVMEGDGVSGPTFSSGLTNQYAWKKLKGGSQKLNNDLLANVLMNWSHLLSASAKNRALTESLKAGVAAGVAQKVPSGTKESVRVRVNGKEEHYLVSDPGVMSAISAIEYRTPGFFRPFSTMKRWLSVGVTANPAYKVKNLIRDSVAAPAVSDLSGNVIGNVAQGIRQGAEDSQTFASMLAGGGVIRFGSMLDGGNADRTRTLVRKEGGVLLDEAGWKKVSNWMGDLWDAYNTVGDKFENANRVALYEQLKAKGYSDLEANFLARDLMDFSMSGRWPLIRFLVETVPFLNARLQGLFKLGRGAKENPRKFGAVVGAVALASIALLAAYEDDEDWKRREDWDRDTNWWFKIGDMSFRIPKPFEVGAIGTIAERGWEMAFNKEMDMKRFGQSLSRMIFSTFAMDPTPQIVKPILDVYMNKGAFTNRPIESMTMARQRPEDRYDENTSYAARFLGQMGIPSPLGLARAEYTKLSPVQIDYLIRGYFAWLGTAATTVLDFGIRPMMDAGDRPDRTLKDTFFVGNFVETLPAGGSRYVTQLYEQSREIEQAYASYRDALKENDRERARELREDYAEEFRARPRVNKATKEIAEIRRQINMIESSKSITGETKRVRIDNLRQKMARIAERATAP